MDIGLFSGLVDEVVTLFGKFGCVVDATFFHAFEPIRN